MVPVQARQRGQPQLDRRQREGAELRLEPGGHQLLVVLGRQLLVAGGWFCLSVVDHELRHGGRVQGQGELPPVAQFEPRQPVAQRLVVAAPGVLAFALLIEVRDRGWTPAGNSASFGNCASLRSGILTADVTSAEEQVGVVSAWPSAGASTGARPRDTKPRHTSAERLPPLREPRSLAENRRRVGSCRGRSVFGPFGRQPWEGTTKVTGYGIAREPQSPCPRPVGETLGLPRRASAALLDGHNGERLPPTEHKSAVRFATLTIHGREHARRFNLCAARHARLLA